jgi:hypothetical protein
LCQWQEGCASFQVTQLDESKRLYRVTRSQPTPNEYRRYYTVEISNQWCSCGKWEVPCIDALAHFCIHEDKPLEYKFENFIYAWYKYKRHQKLFSKNIFLVVIDQLVKDITMLNFKQGDHKFDAFTMFQIYTTRRITNHL